MKRITNMRSMARSIIAHHPSLTERVKAGKKLDAAIPLYFGYNVDYSMDYLAAWLTYTANYAYWSDSGILILVERHTETPIGNIEYNEI